MRRKKHDSGRGSMELLLDTMCNTFGGVIFIAIALTIVASSAPKILKLVTEHDDKIEEIRKIKSEIAKLEKDAMEALEDKKMKQSMEEQIKKHPFYSMIKKLSETENMIKKNQLSLSAAQADKMRAEAELKTLSEQQRECTEINLKKKKKLTADKVEFERVRNELEFVNRKLNSTVPDETMTFTKLVTVEKNEQPYYFVVKNKSIWRIGPDGSNFKPNSDVNYKVKNNLYICNPVETNKTPILDSGKNVSKRCAGIINQISSDRFPQFMVYQDSCLEFYKLSEFLKKNNISFDWNLFCKGDLLGYYFTDKKIEYEKN